MREGPHIHDLSRVAVRRVVVAFVAAVMLLIPPIAANAATASTAASDNGGSGGRSCAIRSDYNKIRPRMTRNQVTVILHNAGRQILVYPVPRIPPLVGRVLKYPVCTSTYGHKKGAYVLVTFWNWRVVAKAARW